MIDGTQPAGTGTFGRDAGGVFLTIQMNGTEEGYNTSAKGIMDTKRVPQFNHEIFVSDLGIVTVSNSDFVPFLLDINESKSGNKSLLSLDDLKIFTTQATGITNPTVESLVADPRLTLRYDLEAGGDSTVLLDYARSSSGSGKADLSILIPSSVFAGAAPSDTVYLYSKFGVFASSDAGFEEFTLGAGNGRLIPEPSSALLGLLASMTFLLRRKR